MCKITHSSSHNYDILILSGSVPDNEKCTIYSGDTNVQHVVVVEVDPIINRGIEETIRVIGIIEADQYSNKAEFQGTSTSSSRLEWDEEQETINGKATFHSQSIIHKKNGLEVIKTIVKKESHWKGNFISIHPNVDLIIKVTLS